MKETVLQTIKIVVFAILFSVCLLFSVLALTPDRSNIQIQKEITVSASSLSEKDGTYLLEIAGTLKNTTAKPILIDRITVRAAGIDEPFSTKEPLLIPPRAEAELLLRETATVAASSVSKVTVSIDGTPKTLLNPAVENPLGYAFLPLALALLFLLLLIHAVIVRVYMEQEKKIKK